MKILPESIARLVEHFDRLPGIGPKHATRLALYLLHQKEYASHFAHDITTALSETKLCARCQNVSNADICALCSNPNRDQKIICVVAHVQDIEPIEQTGKFSGTYHVLHGVLDPIEGITPDDLTIRTLIDRTQKRKIDEIILALDVTSAGEATTLYLMNQLNPFVPKITRLARGIPMGSSIEYTDEVTLTSALENRR